MDQILHLSEVLYFGLSGKMEIGTPSKVIIRRDVWDVEDMLPHRNSVQSWYTDKRKLGCSGRTMLSGSFREGFRFDSSDMDYMFWLRCNKLIYDISQLRDYNPSIHHNIILMEDIDTSPGFVRLQVFTEPRCDPIRLSIITFNDRTYLSSLLWTQVSFQVSSHFMHVWGYRNVSVHGPCVSGYNGSIQFDDTTCFCCKYWPNTTKHWINRCLRHVWPPASVLTDILNDGFHCVAIGSKCTTSRNDLEWRLSFSIAEQKLVYTMNHTQFVCYGFLKIFLKEVINNNMEEPLLCSYFMKTTMFWLIQIGHLRWSPNNLLECFWMCFKYLIHCVYRDKFANFFIPQNNMFLNKIVGVARESLLQQLYQYYRLGVSCLLLSPTLRSILEPALYDLSLASPGGHCTDIVCNDLCTLTEVFRFNPFFFGLKSSFSFLKSVDTLVVNSSLSPYQSLTLQYWTCECFVHAAFLIVNSTSNFKHKYVYSLDRMFCNILKLVSRLGTISHALYLGLFYYRTRRYNEALYVTNLTKRRLSEPHVINHSSVDRNRYREYVSGLSLSRRMKNAWAVLIKLDPGISFIEELTLEQLADSILYIPPSVLVEMLSVLSHYRLGDTSQYKQSLTDLQTLLIYDDGSYVPLQFRQISWLILGICQHVVGDLHGASQSYRESLRQEPFQNLQKSTKLRIDFIQNELCGNVH